MSASLRLVYPRPAIDLEQARRVALEHFGMSGALSELPSERDRNFLIATAPDERFVLKIAHAEELPATLELQHRALERLAERAPGIAVPRVVPSLAGTELVRIDAPDGAVHLARVFSWIPGREWARVSPHTPSLRESLGSTLAQVDRALLGFEHPAATRELKWDLSRSAWIREHLDRVTDPARRALVTRHLDRFEREVLPALAQLRRGVIHNDANDWNVIVAPGHPEERRVAGLVDLGDMLEGPLVADLAIACAYAMQGTRDPLSAAAEVTRGYHRELTLAEGELAVLFPLSCTRLAVSVVNSAEQRACLPDESYLTVSETEAWQTLERLESVHPRLAEYQLRAAAGLEPCPSGQALRQWLAEHPEACGPLLAANPGKQVALDLSVGSALIESPEEPDDLPRFSQKLFERLKREGAAIGVGRYDEARLLYAAPGYEDEGNERDIPRTVHLGLDLFAEPGTPVLAPLAGVVASVRDNGMARDYGPTVILRHAPPGGPEFFTLYGHLGREVLAALRPGTPVVRGQPIATIGALDVNGGWPPHLHFQIVADLLDREGEFPGVARSDRLAVWQSLSPDPNLVAQLPAALRQSPHLSPANIRASRARHLGPSLSLSYRRPLTIVRGWQQYLYDADGLRYLDAVNNVAHVGHSHPRVVQAIAGQAAVLNTNTRYLHEQLVRYAERLTALLPDPLRVCYFVNSGSEANELAIRLARAATGRRGMVVLDVAYHGNTTTLVDVSPYKHDGPGGLGPPSWVRKIPMPDTYRGAYRRDDREAGRRYAAHVASAIEALSAGDEPVAAFLAESILSCGGQIVLPPGFLREAYARTRAAGGVTIADEVQVGLGRVGSHCWAFETQGVVPDIVTLGKPIGNGHPLGAVITTEPIARAFANGMEYFNTFGGNPVSCAAGLAVLDVLRDEALQQRARDVGARLLAGLAGLVARHPLAGDARGLGLFVGLELVRDRTTLEPATEEANYVANRLRERGMLASTDGPFRNVLKFKPPLCVAPEDADRLVDALDRVLAEDFCRRDS